MDEKILIVDDARFARTVLKRSLANGNYLNIVEATTAADAIRLFKKEHPDLVFLDISLPDSDNLSLLEKLLTLDPKARIVMCSALGQELVIADARAKGAKEFIVKPFEEKVLLETVNRLLQ